MGLAGRAVASISSILATRAAQKSESRCRRGVVATEARAVERAST